VLVSCAFAYTILHVSSTTLMLLHILYCLSLNLLSEKIYHKKRQNIQQMPLMANYIFHIMLIFAIFFLQREVAYENMDFLKQVLF